MSRSAGDGRGRGLGALGLAAAHGPGGNRMLPARGHQLCGGPFHSTAPALYKFWGPIAFSAKYATRLLEPAAHPWKKLMPYVLLICGWCMFMHALSCVSQPSSNALSDREAVTDIMSQVSI